MIDLKDMTPRGIERFCVEELGQRPGQGLRLAALLFRKGADDLRSLPDLSRVFREQVLSRCFVSRLSVERTETAQDGTHKLLYRLADGYTAEGVLIPGPDRLTLCVSTQVGCASGCAFCLTGGSGHVRNLTPAEMANQVLAAEQHMAGGQITNIVLMGTGEPLANYDAVMAFLETAADRHGLGFSPRKTTLSTCGLAPMIERLADDGFEASLAVSLNATTDAVRDRIMPVNRAYPLARLFGAMRYYAERTGRTVTVEYVLLRGVNDSNEDALRLVELTEDLPSMVNILCFNPFPGCSYERPEDERLSLFRDILVRAGRIAVVRKSRGRDISAACGQLRAGAREPVNRGDARPGESAGREKERDRK